MENLKAKPMSKPNLEVLLQLIEGKSILTTKATNASNNKLKEEAWQGIASEFSAIVGETRRPDQLKLKWENMKKAARKRTAAIRQNNLKTGGGKSFIQPDDILDRVASMLGATCTGFTVEFGGDATDEPDSPMLPSLTSLLHTSTESQSDNGLGVGNGTNDVRTSVGGEGGNTEYTPRAVLFNNPQNRQNKRIKLADELLKAQVEKETALASYFRAKAEMIKKETEKIQLEIENFNK